MAPTTFDVRDEIMIDQLQNALDLTEAVLDGAVTKDSVRSLLETRGPLLDAAFRAKNEGAEWGEPEAELARRIVAADRKLVDALWQPRKDAFAWLASRREKIEIEMPHISALSYRESA